MLLMKDAKPGVKDRQVSSLTRPSLVFAFQDDILK